MNPEITVKENYEFRRIYRKGKSVVAPAMVLYCQKNRYGRTRLGITVSTKLGCAVKRNRARRRLRELFRLAQPRLKQGFDVVIVARTRAVNVEHRKLQADFDRAMRELDLLLAE